MKEFFERKGCMKQFSTDDFVREYENSYFLIEKTDNKYIPHVSVNSHLAECVIQNILDDGIQTPGDVNTLLAWKIGGIDHVRCKDEIIFKPSWETGETVTERYFECERGKYQDFCQKIANISIDGKSSEALLDSILSICRDTGVTGFGTVYILTILYFLTKGESPIFDRFAFTAAKAIYFGVKPCEIWYENPSAKTQEDILAVIWEYKRYLEEIFGSFNIPRCVDRALWVYGHRDAIK